MRLLRESLFKWIINPAVAFSSTLGSNLTADTTVFKADNTSQTADSITL
jgi:hypothetical protein